MTRIKKLLIAGSMALVTCCVSLSSSILNVSSLYTHLKVRAADADNNFNNSLTESQENSLTSSLNGKVITVSNIPSSAKKGEYIHIPGTVITSTVTGGKVTSASADNSAKVIIKNPYGVQLKTSTEIAGDDSYTAEVLTKLSDSDADYPGHYQFMPAQIGTYTVQYAVQSADGVWTSSNIYRINVTAEQYAIEFASNNPIIMPNKIDTRQELTTADKSVKIALPIFYNGKGEQIKNFVLEKTSDYYYVADYVELNNVYLDSKNSPKDATKNPTDSQGKNKYEKYSTYKIRKIAKTNFETENIDGKYEYSVAVMARVPNATEVSNTDGLVNYTLKLEENAAIPEAATEIEGINYIDCAYSFVADNGLNTVEYRLYETESANFKMPLSSISKGIDGHYSYNRDNINVGVSVSSNIRSSATSIGKKIYLPEVSTVNKSANKETIPAYYYYEVAFIDKDNNKLIRDDDSKLVMGVDEGGIYFIPKVEGNFNIYYNAQDFYYDKVSNKDNHYDSLADDYDYDVYVSDKTSPDFYFVDSYNYDILEPVETEDEEENKKNQLAANKLKEELKGQDTSYYIPTKYYIKKGTSEEDYTKIKIPAIFAEDNDKDFSDSSFTVSRVITSSDGFKIKGETKSDFEVRVQDNTSSNTTRFYPSDRETAINAEGIFIDDIVTFDFKGLPENIYYKNGKFYDKTEATEVTNAEALNLMIVGTGEDAKVVVFKKDEDGSTNIVDTTKRADGKYFVEDGKIMQGKEVNSTTNAYKIKKWKTSASATLIINPELFGAGEYTIEFKVTDGHYVNNTGDKFTFTLVDQETDKELDTKAPEVKFTTATTLGNVGEDEEISIAKPKVTDDVDNRILTKYYVVANNKYVEINLDKDNKLTFKTSLEHGTDVDAKTIYELATESEDKNIKVVAIAYDDFAFGGADNLQKELTIEKLEEAGFNLEEFAKTNGHIGVASYAISVKYIEDTLAPVIYEKLTELGMAENNFKQGEKVLINGITFFDNTENAIVKSIKVVDSKGVEIANQSLTFSDFKEYIDAQVKAGKDRLEVEQQVRKALVSKVEKITAGSDLAVAPGTNYTDYIYKYTFPGISFIATEADNYTITYEVCDSGTNNITVFSFVTKKAADTEAPVITGVATSKEEIQLGQTYYVNGIKVSDNSITDSDTSKISLSWEVYGAKVGYKNNWFTKQSSDTFVFNPQQVDVYTITLTAVDANGNSSSKSFTVDVKDTLKPTITLNQQYKQGSYNNGIASAGNTITINEKAGNEDDKPSVDNNGNTIDWANSKFPSVNLPCFAAEDEYQEKGYASLGAEGTLTIKTPDDASYSIDKNGKVTGGQNEIKLEMREEGGVNYFTFVPTKRGKYTATYTATDYNNNTSEPKVIEIRVGDTEVPSINLTSALINKLNKGFVVGDNDELVINPQARIDGDENYLTQDLYVKDNYKFTTRPGNSNGEEFDYVTVSISVSNENNSTIKQQDSTDGLVRYKFDTAGTYTITFSVTDACGNTGTFHRTFVVSKDKPASLDTTKIVGIVLIVVSVLILGGVVIYFVRGTKFLPKRKKNGKGKKDKPEITQEKQD